MRIVLGFVFLMTTQFLNAQNILGYWKNIDDEDGKPKSIIELYESDGKVHGKVLKLLEGATIKHCIKCSGEKKDAPIEGMEILWDLVYHHADKRKAGDGHILDPKKGKVYGCKIELENDDELKVRGYIKAPLFGRTQTWYRTEKPDTINAE